MATVPQLEARKEVLLSSLARVNELLAEQGVEIDETTKVDGSLTEGLDLPNI